jgi:hypothetical protein
MVLRRSTTDWTWLSDFKNWERSTTIRILTLGAWSMMLSDGPTCAGAILPRGQENGRRAYRQYGRGLRRNHAAKALGP